MPGLTDLTKAQQEELDLIIRTFDRDYPTFQQHYDELNDGYNYLAGIQFTREQKVWHESQRRPARVFNLILPSFNVTLGDFLLNELNVKVFPQPGGTQELADTFRKMIDHVNIDNDIQTVFQDTALAGLVKAGFLHIRYSDEKYIDGSIVIDNTDEFEIMWELSAKSKLLDDSEWIIRMAWKDKNEILNYFPQHRSELQAVLNEKEDMTSTQLTPTAISALHNRNFLVENERDGKYLIIEYHRMRFEETEVVYDPVTQMSKIWNLEGKKADLFRRHYPQARIIKRRAKLKTVTQVIPGLYYWLDKKDADIQDQQHDYIPFFAFSYGKTSLGNFGIFRNAKDPQDDLNSWRNQLNNLINKIINPGGVFKPEHFENPEDVENFFGAPGVQLRADTTEPLDSIYKSLGDYLTRMPMAPDILVKESAEFLQRIVNVTEALYGVQESATEPASLYAQKVKRALVAFQGMYYNWSTTKRRLYSKVISHIQTNMTTERYFLITDPKTESTEEVFLNWRQGEKILCDVTVGRYQIVVDDIDKHPTAKFARFRQKTEVVQMVTQMFGGAIQNPLAIIFILNWWLSDSELGDISEFINAFAQALGMGAKEQQEALQQQEAIGITSAMLDMAKKQLDLVEGNNGGQQPGFGNGAPRRPQNNNKGFSQ